MFQENSIKSCIVSRVKQITSPGWMHETSAQTWCTGKPRGSGWIGRWERDRDGNTCKSMAVSFQCMTKFTTNKKKKEKEEKKDFEIDNRGDGRENGFQVRYRACVVIHTVCFTSYMVDMMS